MQKPSPCSQNDKTIEFFIEIIDIECVLFEKNLFSVKNLSPQNDGFIRHFGWSQTPEAGNFARLQQLQGVRIVFSTAKIAKNFISRLKMEKKVLQRRKKCLKPILVGFFTKSNSSEQNIYRNRRLKINCQRCCARQNETRKIKTK